MSSRVYSKSEAIASELLETLEDMFILYYMHSDIVSMFSLVLLLVAKRLISAVFLYFLWASGNSLCQLLSSLNDVQMRAVF